MLQLWCIFHNNYGMVKAQTWSKRWQFFVIDHLEPVQTDGMLFFGMNLKKLSYEKNVKCDSCSLG